MQRNRRGEPIGHRVGPQCAARSRPARALHSSVACQGRGRRCGGSGVEKLQLKREIDRQHRETRNARAFASRAPGGQRNTGSACEQARGLYDNTSLSRPVRTPCCRENALPAHALYSIEWRRTKCLSKCHLDLWAERRELGAAHFSESILYRELALAVRAQMCASEGIYTLLSAFKLASLLP